MTDSVGSFSPYSNATLKVNPLDQSQQVRQLSKLIALSDGSNDYRMKIVTVVSTSLNTPNCSMALNCTSLHRQACAKTAFTCSGMLLLIDS